MFNRKYLYFIILVSILVLLSFWRVIFFDFWRDDWGFLWTAQHQPLNLVGLTVTVHSATWLEDVVLIRLFGWNPIYWNIFGLFLRVLSALSLGLMMWSFMRQKKAAVLSSLFFASSYIGLETVGWLSSHVVPITIILICSGFYFWFRYKNKNNFSDLILAIILFSLAFMGDPGRTFPVILLILIWEAFSFFLNRDKKQLFKNIFSILLLGNLLLAIYLFLTSHFGVRANQVLNLQSFFQSPETFKYYFASLGNLLLSGFIKIEEFGGTSSYNFYIATAGALILLAIIISSFIIGLTKRSEKILAITWFTLWIPILYLPNWLFNPTYVASGTHRYLGLAGVGLIGAISLLITSIKNRNLSIFLSTLWIVINIFVCNRVLEQESFHRSINNVERVWNKVIADIPRTKGGEIFIFTGDYALKQSIVEWSGRIWPYVVKTNVKNYPQVVLDYQQALDILCNNVAYNLDNIYSWQIERNMVVNTSQKVREYLKKNSLERNCYNIINNHF